MHIRLAVLSALLQLFSVTVAQAQSITVQIINDSGLSDEDVYVLLTGGDASGPGGTSYPVSTSGIAFANAAGNSSAVSSQAVSTLQNTGQTLTSPFSGDDSLPIYEFTITTVGSGRLFVSYNQAISYQNAAPTAFENYRYDKLEITYNENIASGLDLTSMDFYGIPMQVEIYSASDTLEDVMGFYTSTPTLLSRFGALGSSMGDAFINTSGGQFDPSTGSLSTFARIIGPGQLSAAPANNGSPAPYPSFTEYLATLAAANYTFTEAGSANGSTYNYTGTVSFTYDEIPGIPPIPTGFAITLTPNGANALDPAPPAPLPDDAIITLPLPFGALDAFIYNVPQNSETIALDPMGGLDSSNFDTNVPNSVYGWIQADVMSGLNFGYLNGVHGNSIAPWYGTTPTNYPFGGARNPLNGGASNDGFYNPYAAMFYNNSDAYGFAFSDRSGPSPDVGVQENDIVRIWILPDGRLDAPVVAIDTSATTASSVTVQWPAIQNVPSSTTVTGYEIQVAPPPGAGSDPITVPFDAATTTYSQVVSNLNAFTPYAISVTAVGTANGNAVASATIPIHATTGGTTLTPVNVPDGVEFVLGFNWGAVPTGAAATINGTALTNLDGGSLPLTGNIGSNYYVLNVQDGTGTTLFESNYMITFGGTADAYTIPTVEINSGTFADPTQSGLLGNQTDLSVAGPPGTPPYSSQNQLTLGTSFNPAFTKAVFPVSFPAAPTPQPAPRPVPPSPTVDPAIALLERQIVTVQAAIVRDRQIADPVERARALQRHANRLRRLRLAKADPDRAEILILRQQIADTRRIQNPRARQRTLARLRARLGELLSR